MKLRWVKCGYTSTQDHASSVGGNAVTSYYTSPFQGALGTSFKKNTCAKNWGRKTLSVGETSRLPTRHTSTTSTYPRSVVATGAGPPEEPVEGGAAGSGLVGGAWTRFSDESEPPPFNSGFTRWVAWDALEDVGPGGVPTELLESLSSLEETQGWAEQLQSEQQDDDSAGQARAAGQLVENPTLRRHGGFEGKWARLRPLAESDLPIMYEAEVGTSWRLNGGAPDFCSHASIVSANVLLQLVITSTEDGRPLGFMAGYDADMRGGHCYVVAASFSARSEPAFFEGSELFINHLFVSLPLRKLYFESDQPQLVDLMSRMTPELLQEEARLTEHTYQAGRYCDRVTFALRRDAWERSASFYGGET